MLPMLPALHTLVGGYIKSLPELDACALKAAVDELRQRPPTAKARSRADR